MRWNRKSSTGPTKSRRSLTLMGSFNIPVSPPEAPAIAPNTSLATGTRDDLINPRGRQGVDEGEKALGFRD